MFKKILFIPKNIVVFFRDTAAELRLVKWIKGNLVVKYTIAIMLFLILGALTITVIDKAFLLIRGLVIPTA